jgi:type I restriction enzyme S subunit
MVEVNCEKIGMSFETKFKETEIGMIPEDWDVKKVNQVTDQIFSGGTPDTRKSEYWNGNIPWLSSGETSNTFIFETERKITESGVKNSSTRLAKIGDIVVASAGQGYTRGQVSFCMIDTYVNQSVVVLRANKEILEPRFLFYNLVSRYNELRRISDAHSSRGSLTTKLLADLDIQIPPIQEQTAIAKILSDLDLKIALNRQMNSTLEAIGQALFKHWFVDFEFPNEEGKPYRSSGRKMEETELGEAPKGWRIMTIRDILELAYGKSLKEQERHAGTIPVYGSNGQIGWHDEKLAEGPGIVVGRKGNPGIITWSHTAFFAIDTTFYVVPKGEIQSMYYLFHALRLQDLPSLGADSAVPGLNRNLAYMNKIIVPTPNVLEMFDTQLRGLYNQVYSNEKQSRTLAALRDTLLPKLMSGEIRVKAEQNSQTI